MTEKIVMADIKLKYFSESIILCIQTFSIIQVLTRKILITIDFDTLSDNCSINFISKTASIIIKVLTTIFDTLYNFSFSNLFEANSVK
jgi:hypothetical protein